MFDYPCTHPYRLEFMDANTVSFDKSKTNNQALLKWLDKMVDMCGPKEVRWCDGSDREWDELCGLMIEQGSMIALNKEKRPNSYLVRSDPRDVARVESRTFICSYAVSYTHLTLPTIYSV